MNKAIFLDRDGVLNDVIVKNGKPYPPSTLEEFCISEQALPALALLKSLGYLLIGATNQPDVPRGKTERSFVETLNSKLMQALPLDEIRVCYHDDTDQCHCRKPSPGLLTDAAQEHDIDLKQSIMIGDRWRDIAAGEKAGCKTIFLNYGYDEKQPERADFITRSLLEAAQWIKEQG